MLGRMRVGDWRSRFVYVEPAVPMRYGIRLGDHPFRGRRCGPWPGLGSSSDARWSCRPLRRIADRRRWQLVEEQLPQLVLVDASLRDGSGLQLGESLRDRYPELPVILLTAATQSGSKPSGWAAGRLLSKSVDLSDLRQAVTAALAGNQANPPMLREVTPTEIPSPPPSSLPNPGPAAPAKEPAMLSSQAKSFKSVAGILATLLVLVALAVGGRCICRGRARRKRNRLFRPPCPISARSSW